jgi:pSer/pThr/pTyr-binding forkhead associated (FHA) protein
VESDLLMSKHHFSVSFDGARCDLTDLNSTNGTTVNGKSISSVRLTDGDIVRAGSTEFTVRFIGETPAMMMAPEAGAGDESGVEAQLADQDEGRVGLGGTNRQVGAAPIDASDWVGPRVVTLRIKSDSMSPERAGVLSRSLAWLRSGQCISVGNCGFVADWRIPDDIEIASQHFRLEFDGQVCILQSLDSEKETLVNGQAADRRVLKDGDIVTAGHTNFVVEFSW